LEKHWKIAWKIQGNPNALLISLSLLFDTARRSCRSYCRPSIGKDLGGKMKHKPLVLISMALTVFSLILIAGVIVVVRQVNAAAEPATAAQEQVQNSAAPDTAVATISPQQAAELAAVYMGRSDLYTVESATLNSQPTFLVTFSTGDQVYVSLDGQVLGIVPAQQINSSQNSASNFGFREHEEHESREHEGFFGQDD
jgi:hypothetical protein